MTKHEAALMLERINEDFSILTDRAREALQMGIEALDERSEEEWCIGCKEYDQEQHNCPRFNRVIETAVQEAKEATRNETEKFIAAIMIDMREYLPKFTPCEDLGCYRNECLLDEPTNDCWIRWANMKLTGQG